MSEGTLYDKVWERHRVTTLPNGQDQLFVGLHLIHEVTSPQAFGMLRERDIDVARPDLTHATVDHIVPTDDQSRPLANDAAEEMMAELEANGESRPSSEAEASDGGERDADEEVMKDVAHEPPGDADGAQAAYDRGAGNE